jgi:hypothetical protein
VRSYPAGKLTLPPSGIIDDYIFNPSFYSAIEKNFTQIAVDVKQTTGKNSSTVWWCANKNCGLLFRLSIDSSYQQHRLFGIGTNTAEVPHCV